MGKWAEVQCACLNRTPIPGSDPILDRPHRRKHRLTKSEQAEVEEWKQTTENMFACGHRSGLVIEFWPGDIIHLGSLLDSTFEVFTRVGDWRCYEDELLLIQPDEARFWLKEIEELQKTLESTDQLDDLVSKYYRDELDARVNLEARLDQVEAEMPFAPIVLLKRNVQQTKRPDIESTIETINEALSDAVKLCRTSIETGNPIRLLW